MSLRAKLLHPRTLWLVMAAAFLAGAFVFSLDAALATWVRVALAIAQVLAALAALLQALHYPRPSDEGKTP